MGIRLLVGRLVVLGAAVAVIGGSAVAFATGGNDSAVYKACLKTDKTLYNVLVTPRSEPSCRSGDKVIVWNETGPPGPRGAQDPAAHRAPWARPARETRTAWRTSTA